MFLVDVHAHLDYEDFNNDLEEVLEEAKKTGIRAIINNGLDPETNRKTKELAEKHPIIKPAYGYYPEKVIKDGLKAVEEEIRWIKENKPVAIGEVGLDFKEINEEEKEKQITAFKQMIRLAKELRTPIIVHSRKAEEETIRTLEEEKAEKVILHCFTGNKKIIRKALDLKYNFSIPVIIIKSQQFQELVKEAPLKQLLTETDAPFLGPERGKRNTPKNISLSIKKIAEIKGLTTEDCANQIFFNYQRLFL